MKITFFSLAFSTSSLSAGLTAPSPTSTQSKTLVGHEAIPPLLPHSSKPVRHSVRADVANDKFIPQPKLVNQF